MNAVWNGENTMWMDEWLRNDRAEFFEECRAEAEKKVKSKLMRIWPPEWGESELEAVVYEMGELLYKKVDASERFEAGPLLQTMGNWALYTLDWQQIAGVYLGAEWCSEPIYFPRRGTVSRTTLGNRRAVEEGREIPFSLFA